MTAKDAIFPERDLPFAQRSACMSMDVLEGASGERARARVPPRESSFLQIENITSKARKFVHPDKDVVAPISEPKLPLRLRKPRDLSLVPMFDQRDSGSMNQVVGRRRLVRFRRGSGRSADWVLTRRTGS